VAAIIKAGMDSWQGNWRERSRNAGVNGRIAARPELVLSQRYRVRLAALTCGCVV
jgi:hypothetical protein